MRLARTLNEQCGDIMRTLYVAAHADPAAAPAWAEGRRRHRRGSEAAIGKLRELGAPRADVAPARAVDVFAYFTGPQSGGV